jgi:cellulose synthase/poly-beta-1,6-N-acetylglucosamine synthase-like glycosyltransferase
MPLISVIVACRNEEKDIGDCIKSLVNQTLPSSYYEIIFVDGMSRDATPQIIKKYARNLKNIKLFFENPPISPANARNIGVKKSRGKYIVFVDADNVATKDYLLRIIECFKKYKAECISTKTLPITRSLFGTLMYYERLASDYIALKRGLSFFPNAFKKRTFLRLGGFDSNLGYGEDLDLYHKLTKLGIRIVYCPQATIYHKEPSSLKEIYKEGVWWGKTLPLLIKKYPYQILRLIAIISRALLLLWIFLIFVPSFRIFGIILTSLTFLELTRYIYRAVKGGGELKIAILLPLYKIIKALFILVGIFIGVYKRGRKK